MTTDDLFERWKNDRASGWNITQHVLEEEEDPGGGRKDGVGLRTRHIPSLSLNNMQHASKRYYHKTL